MTRPRALQRAMLAYEEQHSNPATMIVRAPGRVNLIGEHTDYNNGFVLPMALPFDIVIAGEPRHDGQVVATSEGFEPVSFSLERDATAPDGPAVASWALYVRGTAHMLAEAGHEIQGWQASIASDIPAGASLSSSAALEVAAGLAFVTAAGGDIDRNELARIGQLVENNVLGLPSGIMDQLASATSLAGAASLIDCRDLTIEAVPLPDGVEVVIMDTGTRRELVDSEYAARRADCETAAAELGVESLRDAAIDQLSLLSDERVTRRARHVITENERTLNAATALAAGDASAMGVFMNASHSSLRDDFEVSGPALDSIVALAQKAPGCYGARMTGGGFAGAAVALVEAEATSAFVDAVLEQFTAPPEQPSTAPVALYAARAAAGASVVASAT